MTGNRWKSVWHIISSSKSGVIPRGHSWMCQKFNRPWKPELYRDKPGCWFSVGLWSSSLASHFTDGITASFEHWKNVLAQAQPGQNALPSSARAERDKLAQCREERQKWPVRDFGVSRYVKLMYLVYKTLFILAVGSINLWLAFSSTNLAWNHWILCVFWPNILKFREILWSNIQPQLTKR